MEVLYQPALLERYLKKYGIREKFDTKELEFRLIRFEKGEYLTSPIKVSEHLLFLVKGTVQIYSLRADTSVSPVTVQRPPAFFGDMEFATGHPTPFFSEAAEEVLCIALSLPRYGAFLARDCRFLSAMLRSVGEKLNQVSLMDASGRTLEERLLYYMEHLCRDGTLSGINDAVGQLRCSRRQLQRVLADLCRQGRIEKTGKGIYRLLNTH